MARKIEVVDYDSNWEKDFKIEAKKIKEILGKNCVEIHHFGSTSVKGLKAKPIIDIMPVVKELSLVDEHIAEFEALGYEYKGEYGISGRRFLAKGGDHPTHHIHIYEQSNTAEIGRHLAVRNYLRNHPDAAKEYGELKTVLAEQFTYDIDGYCNGKDKFVKELEEKAMEWEDQQGHLGQCMSIGMCLGVGVGAAFGMMFSNIGIGMCFGLSIGMCLGLAVGSFSDKKD